MSRPLTLGELKRATTPARDEVPATVGEWDVTPGLHEWIEGER